eukprot:5385-Pleurochrysis_carterae.AAC.2
MRTVGVAVKAGSDSSSGLMAALARAFCLDGALVFHAIKYTLHSCTRTRTRFCARVDVRGRARLRLCRCVCACACACQCARACMLMRARARGHERHLG